MTEALALAAAAVLTAVAWMQAAAVCRRLRRQRDTARDHLAELMQRSAGWRWLLICHDIDPDTGEIYADLADPGVLAAPLTDDEWATSIALLSHAFERSEE